MGDEGNLWRKLEDTSARVLGFFQSFGGVIIGVVVEVEVEVELEDVIDEDIMV